MVKWPELFKQLGGLTEELVDEVGVGGFVILRVFGILDVFAGSSSSFSLSHLI